MKEENNINKSTSTKFWPMIWVTLLIVLIIFVGLWQLNFMWHGKPGSANEFGDSFGMANALFSALAFAFLIVTAIMQRKELELQRQELSETRKELTKSTKAQDASQKALNSQVRIMAKQALLSSYGDLYQLNLENSRNRNDPLKGLEESKKDAKIYLGLIEHMMKELEKEQELFSDSETLELVKQARQL